MSDGVSKFNYVECNKHYGVYLPFGNKPISIICAEAAEVEQALIKERDLDLAEVVIDKVIGIDEEVPDSIAIDVSEIKETSEHPTVFTCIECHQDYTSGLQFEGKPICIHCAQATGITQILEREREESAHKKIQVDPVNFEQNHSDIENKTDKAEMIVAQNKEEEPYTVPTGLVDAVNQHAADLEPQLDNIQVSVVTEDNALSSVKKLKETKEVDELDLDSEEGMQDMFIDTEIFENTEVFTCSDCHHEFKVSQKFENTSVCFSCAEISGISQRLRKKRTQEYEQFIKNSMIAPVQDNVLTIKAQSSSKHKILDVDKQANVMSVANNKRSVAVSGNANNNELKITDVDWINVSGGEFFMGSPVDEEGRGGDECLHRLEIAPFKIMATAVTFEQYDAFCAETGREQINDKGWGRGLRPVVYVSYWDAVDYAAWLSEQTGWLCRLPTEAEWEYACRAGTSTAFNTGKSISGAQANYDGLYTYAGGTRAISRWKTVPVASFPANAWGIYDMHGNVWEWCASEYDSDCSGLEKMDASSDRMNNMPRPLRGGSWHSRPVYLRSACRYRFMPDERSYEWGFRLVCTES